MDPTPIRAPRRAGFLQLAAFVLLAAGLPALVPVRASGRIASSIHAVSRPAEIARLEQEKAEVVVVGDSMVPCRIDPAELTRLLEEKRAANARLVAEYREHVAAVKGELEAVERDFGGNG